MTHTLTVITRLIAIMAEAILKHTMTKNLVNIIEERTAVKRKISMMKMSSKTTVVEAKEACQD